MHLDRPIKGHDYRTSVTVGARTVQDYLGYTGAGIGVAVIDSGHHDLARRPHEQDLEALSRTAISASAKFVDFVNGRALPYDDNGHGSTCPASSPATATTRTARRRASRPDANIISLKVLDEHGKGTISNIIAALELGGGERDDLQHPVVNMSVGAGVYESYWTDPLTLAAKRITDKGITVVAAAGNMGKNAQGQLQYGAITAPGNAPWVLTVGASSTNGTLTRYDDKMADYSSSGPTFIDFDAKPDLVAPGTGTVSLAAPGSTFYIDKATSLLSGKLLSLGSTKPYLALSGTSMAAPVCQRHGRADASGQSEPDAEPDQGDPAVHRAGVSGLQPAASGRRLPQLARRGAPGEVLLTRRKAGDVMPVQSVWSRHDLWGNHRLKRGVIKPSANAWANNIVWGIGDERRQLVAALRRRQHRLGHRWPRRRQHRVGHAATPATTSSGARAGDGDNIVWGTTATATTSSGARDCGGADCDDTVWGTADPRRQRRLGHGGRGRQHRVGHNGDGDNIVWGTSAPMTTTSWGSERR